MCLLSCVCQTSTVCLVLASLSADFLVSCICLLQPTLLLQHVRTLLIACKSSGVAERQLLDPLTAVPGFWGPAIQVCFIARDACNFHMDL